MLHDPMEKMPETHEEEIDLRELFSVLWKGRVSILLISLLGAVLSVFYAKSLPNIYTSEAILAPKSESSGLGGLANQFGGLAGLAGISIGGSEGSKTQIAIEILKSRGFFAEFIYEDVLVALMASKDWDSTTNELVIDRDIYDPESLSWVRPVSFPSKAKPSIQEAYQVFSGNHFSITEDTATGFIELQVNHYSPTVALEWLELMLQSIETSVREKETVEAEKSIAYLKAESSTNSLISLNQVFAGLIEEQTKKIVLANASEEYVFQIIEPPVAAELKSGPKRALICVLGVLLAGMLSILYVLVKFYMLNKTELASTLPSV